MKHYRIFSAFNQTYRLTFARFITSIYHWSVVPVRGLSIKDVRSQECCPGWTFCGQEEVFRCEHPHFLLQKLRISKFMVCPTVCTDKEEVGLSQCGQGRVLLCRRLLWKAPNISSSLKIDN